MRTLRSLFLGSILGAVVLWSPSAAASDVGVSVSFGSRPAPVIVDGGYYEYVWVDPVYRTEVYYGTPRQVIVTHGYYRPVYRTGYYRPYYGTSFHYHHGHNQHWYGHRDRYGYVRRDKPGRYR